MGVYFLYVSLGESAVPSSQYAYTVYTPLSGVPRFPIPRSANSDSPLKLHDLYGKQQLRRRCRAPLKGDSPLNGTPLKGVYTVLPW